MKQWIATLAAVLVCASSASAQDGWATEPMAPPEATVEPMGESLPTAYTARPLTLPKMHLRGALSFRIQRISAAGFSATAVGLDIGGGFGITDDLEVGIGGQRLIFESYYPGTGLIPLQLSPDFAFGDINVYGRYRFLNTDTVQIGADLQLNIPTSSSFGFSVGVPVRLTFGAFAVDLAAMLFARFPSGDTTFALFVPVNATYSITENIYAGLQTGFTTDFGGVSVPLGVRAGYSLPIGGAGLLDIEPVFMFPAFFNAPDGGDAGVVTEIYQFMLNARFHYDLQG